MLVVQRLQVFICHAVRYVNDFIMIACDFQQVTERKACSFLHNGNVAHAFCRLLIHSKGKDYTITPFKILHASKLLTADYCMIR